MPPRVRIERRDAHEPVHAAFGLQPAIGVGAGDAHRRRFDAGALARALLEPFDLVAALLGPAHIHAQQHLGPVLRLGAAGAGMDFEIAVVGVGLARQEALDLAPLRLLVQGLRAASRRRRRSPDRPRPRRVRSARPHSSTSRSMRLIALDGLFEPVALAQYLLRLGRIVPELRVLGLVVQLGETPVRDVPVKDASSAAPTTS